MCMTPRHCNRGVVDPWVESGQWMLLYSKARPARDDNDENDDGESREQWE